MPSYSNRVSTFGTTIFTEINVLAQKHGAINLGQGRPDFDGPNEVIEASIAAMRSGKHNQYAPGSGTASLKKAVADHAARFYDLDVNPESGVVITSGATEGIFSSMLGLVDAGDEVIVIEPYFDSYVPNIIMANATPVFVPLRPPDWTFDRAELRAAFGPKTRAIILNTPQNPTGRVFTYDEMKFIGDLCIEFDVVCISDEVYEHLVFGDARHIPMASIPGMFERTVTIGSLGKSFSFTGWKLGWVSGHPDLIAGVGRAHQFVTFASHHPSQEAAAVALSLPGTYFEEFQEMYTTKRKLMLDGLSAAGLKPFSPEGTYFIMADFADVFDGDALEFTQHLVTEIGVACIPPAPFFAPEHQHLARTQARFSFCKADDTLKQAGERLAKLSR
ncbi:MAG: aminotransferase class I/II-fold pyridoxal phosphate-dependent enzyme [Burkholderiales bacterium]|nr:aminotransferase class I/II-fold pyridoxal phosphate-dependent enzyme [Anaerolineae bacterium]